MNHGEQFDLDLAPTIAAIAAIAAVAAIAAIANPSYSKLPALGLAADAALWSLELKDGTPGPGCSSRASDPLPGGWQSSDWERENWQILRLWRYLVVMGVAPTFATVVFGCSFFLGWKIVSF